MSKRRVRAFFTILQVLLDAGMTALAFYLAYWLRLWIDWPSKAVNLGPFSNYVGMMVIQVITILVVFFATRLYHLARAVSRIDEFYQIFGGVSVGTLLSVAITSFVFKNSVLELDYSRAMILYAWLLTIVLVTGGRLVHHKVKAHFQAQGWGTDRVLIVGTGEVGRMILQKIRWSPRLGYEVVGVVATNGAENRIVGVPVVGTADRLGELIEQYDVNEVIIALPEATHQELLMLLSQCDRGSVSIKVFPDLFQIMASQVSIGDLGGLPLITVRDVALRGWRLAVKRAVDIVGSAVALVLLSPLMLLTAVLIKLDSPGPVFYAQERMGLDARPFMMLKFRSMRADAEADGPGWTRPGDPRVTRLGRILRRLSIDELPQLINVLLGDMSLVGPRPERPVYVNQFRRSIPRYMERHREKAGLTGWAQVNGLRGDTSIAERTKYDLWYIENWSLWLDFKIIVRTLFQLFTDRNAY
ncbi:MAG: undecaprenyl-phosphate glucose phosphotransferase [Chloroflexi bacterium]|nr:MAG: undecaprenyl-phosphate glucose phosphotransferase [Chloroflexota bacterium]